MAGDRRSWEETGSELAIIYPLVFIAGFMVVAVTRAGGASVEWFPSLMLWAAIAVPVTGALFGLHVLISHVRGD